MEKNSSSSPLGNTGEVDIKTKVRVYKFQGTLRTEFSNIEQAREFVGSMAGRHPDLLFEPYIERRSGSERRSGNERRKGNERRSGAERRSALIE